MSIPPQLIRVKRKRDDESPVTFLQFDEGAKRHRTGNNWAYQRRHVAPHAANDAPTRPMHDVKPVIHVSSPDGHAAQSQHTSKSNTSGSVPGTSVQSSGAGTPNPNMLTEPRRFHISKKMMIAGANQTVGSGVSKKQRYGPAVFIERSRSKEASGVARSTKKKQSGTATPGDQQQVAQDDMPVNPTTDERRLKKPGVRSRGKSPQPGSGTHTPLPASATSPHNEEMSKRAADMNDWVLREIGANLEEMEQEKRKAEKTKFKPKAPAKRYQERHPSTATTPVVPDSTDVDMVMSDMSEVEDEDEWVIEEYVRIPVHAMKIDVAPTDVGVLVLDGEEDNNLFFGPERDEDEELDEDDEDENAENYYTADYPEDEVDSGDEYGRQAYEYRNKNASDDEEFDNDEYDEADHDIVMEGDDDDATMARIKAYMTRNHAFR